MPARIVSYTAAFLFISWAYCHTDEIPVIFGFLLGSGFILGFAFPKHFWISGLILGVACPIDELLIGLHWLRAPFEGGHPLNACVAFLPALLGATVGRFSRKVNPVRLQ